MRACLHCLRRFSTTTPVSSAAFLALARNLLYSFPAAGLPLGALLYPFKNIQTCTREDAQRHFYWCRQPIGVTGKGRIMQDL